MLGIMAYRRYPHRERALRQIDRHYEPGMRAQAAPREAAGEHHVGEYRISTRPRRQGAA
jgi:hypothetical protein